MIIELIEGATEEQRDEVAKLVKGLGYKPTYVQTQRGEYFVAIGKADFDIRVVGHHPHVRDVYRVSDAYKLVSRKWKAKPTRISLGDGVEVREGGLSLMAGPCSIESEEQVRAIVGHLSQCGVQIMRGGAFKPRTSPYAFRGLGLDGLKMWHQVAKEHNIKIVTEVMEISQIEPMYEYVDMYQVGARNTQNYSLLHELGNVDKPVLIKRGISGTLDELLQSAEYIFANGNEKLLLCERGVRTYESSYRNMLDINAIPTLKEKSHLPVIIDPSHGIGVRQHVKSVALAGVIAGADGVIFETHPEPERAFSDAQQTLNFDESKSLVERARAVFELRKSFDLPAES
ncbi:MAG: 3-deoxy-7-phosphoheptulonate synthase [Bdellovibrionales bacterium]|nr:3-deoxy-7-phosphoheptulonate synthase [Bdellovibrionales bacterium]